MRKNIKEITIVTYSIYTPISLLIKKFGEEYERGTSFKFIDEFGEEQEIGGVYYYFPKSNTLVSIVTKVTAENPDGEDSLDGDSPISKNLMNSIDWDFQLEIPRSKFPTLHNVFYQIGYYTEYYFCSTCTRNEKLNSKELSESITFTLPCPTSKLIFNAWQEYKDDLDFRKILLALGFNYSKTLLDLEEDLKIDKLLSEIVI